SMEIRVWTPSSRRPRISSSSHSPPRGRGMTARRPGPGISIQWTKVLKDLAGEVPEAGNAVVVQQRPSFGEERLAVGRDLGAPGGAAHPERHFDGASGVDDVADRVGGKANAVRQVGDLLEDRAAGAAHVDARGAVDEAADERLDGPGQVAALREDDAREAVVLGGEEELLLAQGQADLREVLVDAGQGLGREVALREAGPVEAAAAAPRLAEFEQALAASLEDVAVEEFDGDVEAVLQQAAAGDAVGAEEQRAVALGPRDDAGHLLADGVFGFLGEGLPIVRVEQLDGHPVDEGVEAADLGAEEGAEIGHREALGVEVGLVLAFQADEELQGVR